MRNYRQLSTFTLVLLFLSGAFKPFNFFIVEALAACTIQGAPQTEPVDPTDPTDSMEPTSGATEPNTGDVVVCNDADTAGIDAIGSSEVTVTVTSEDGSISVTDNPGIRLGDGASVTIEAPDRPVTVQGNDVPGIEVGNMSEVTIEGVVSTTGDFSSAIVAGDGSTVTIDGGDGRRQIVDVDNETESETGNEIENGSGSEVVIVSEGGIVTTAGAQSAAITVGAGSMVDAIRRSQISTTGDGSDAVVLSGAGSQLNVGAEATVTTEGSLSSAVQVNGEGSQLAVDGTVSSAASGTTAVLGTADDVELTVRDGGLITALSDGSSAIAITGSTAQITIANGGEVKVASGDSVAIIAGSGAVVTVDGVVSAAGAGSQGIVLREGATLSVESQGRIETADSAAEAVRIGEMASTATVNVASGGVINASGAQAIVDVGDTDTTVLIDGSVTGGAGSSLLSLGGGDDNVTVNGSVTSTSAFPVVDLGSGNDVLNDNSSETIAGSGILASGGSGSDILNLSNGRSNNSANYQQFEVTNLGTNNNPNDPLNGNGTTLNVTDDQSGNEINVAAGSTLNVRDGGTADLRAEGTDNPSGSADNTIAFFAGSTANVEVQNATGAQPPQTFRSTSFAPGTRVNTSSGFIRGVASTDETTGIGQIELSSDFTNSARTSNGMTVGRALNELAESSALSTTQQDALNELIADASDTSAGEAVLSSISGEINAQAAASGVNAAMQFNNALLPSGNRVNSRGATIATNPDRAGRVFEQPAVGNSAWVSGLGSLLDVSRNDDSTAFEADSYGIAVGYDRAATLGTFGTAVFGVGAGYSSTDVSGISDSATVETFSLGTYLEGGKGPFSGHLAASYSAQDISGGGSGNIFAISSEGFYNLQPNSGLAVGPIGRLGAAFGSYEGFSTEGSAFGIDYDSADVSQVTGAVGVRIGGQNPVNVGFMALNLDLLYESSLGDNTVQFDGKLGDSDVSIAAPTMNQSGFYIGAEAALAISDNSSIGFRYHGNLGSDIHAHTGEIKFSLLF